MRKILLAILFTLLIVGVVNAVEPTNLSPSGYYVTVIDTPIDTSGAFDTLTSATDSSLVLENFCIKPGWEYILERDAITGTGSDSVKVIVNINAVSTSGSLMHRYAVDSMTTSAGEAYIIPFHNAAFGDPCEYEIELMGYAAIGSQVIINRLQMWRRFFVNTTKKNIPQH